MLFYIFEELGMRVIDWQAVSLPKICTKGPLRLALQAPLMGRVSIKVWRGPLNIVPQCPKKCSKIFRENA